MKRLWVSTIQVGKTLRENYSEKDIDDALKVLDEASKKLEEINDKLKGEKHD